MDTNRTPDLDFQTSTTSSGMELTTSREHEIWNDGFEEAMERLENEAYQIGNRSVGEKAYPVLTKVSSLIPDFKMPTRRNGEELDPMSVAAFGLFIIVRYRGWEPVEGSAAEDFVLDVFYNSEGREVFRAQSKIFQAPPDPPTFLERLKFALYLLMGPLPVPTTE